VWLLEKTSFDNMVGIAGLLLTSRFHPLGMFESRPFQRRPRGPAQQDADFAPLKRSRGQRPVDYYSSAIRYLQMAPYVHPSVSMVVPPHDYYAKDVLPPLATPFNMSTAICTQWAHTAHYPDTQRNLERGFPRRRNIFTNAVWAPSGRKLLCTVSNGEFIVFNGQSFGVEHKTTAHEDGRMCRAAAWSGLTDAVLTGDDAGIVKLWGSNLQVAAEFDCNQRSIRAVEWAPSEKRFCTAGQDGSVRIWDTERVAASAAGTAPEVESKLEGHGGDVICVKWHPTKALLATGSQDKCCRLWDPACRRRQPAGGTAGPLRARHQHRLEPLRERVAATERRTRQHGPPLGRTHAAAAVCVRGTHRGREWRRVAPDRAESVRERRCRRPPCVLERGRRDTSHERDQHDGGSQQVGGRGDERA
jgi:WD40 repeat protein